MKKYKDSKYLQDIGIKLKNRLSEHKFIEYQKDGSKIITHYKGDDKWITRERSTKN